MPIDLLNNYELDPRCLFCNTSDPLILDVRTNEVIRYYTDSPYKPNKPNIDFSTLQVAKESVNCFRASFLNEKRTA